jgi:hypothetical protein
MPSIREQILQKVTSQLETISGVGTVERSKITPITVGIAYPAVFIFEESEGISIESPTDMGNVTKTLNITLQCWQLDDGSGNSAQLNTLLSSVETSIMGNVQWDALANRTVPIESRNFYVDYNNTKGFGYIGFELDVFIEYRHTFYDPDTSA